MSKTAPFIVKNEKHGRKKTNIKMNCWSTKSQSWTFSCKNCWTSVEKRTTEKMISAVWMFSNHSCSNNTSSVTFGSEVVCFFLEWIVLERLYNFVFLTLFWPIFGLEDTIFRTDVLHAICLCTWVSTWMHTILSCLCNLDVLAPRYLCVHLYPLFF